MRHGFSADRAGGLFALFAGMVIAMMVIRIVTRTEARLEREKELAEVTLHSIVDGVITTDAAGASSIQTRSPSVTGLDQCGGGRQATWRGLPCRR